jgi:DHA2 family multidrug resistance protein
MMTVGRVVKRVDNRFLMLGGFLFLGCSTFLLTRLNLDIVPSNISWPLVASGFCMGFIFVPLTTLSVSTLRQDQIQQATGLYALLRNLGASVGISLMIALQIRAAQAHQAVLVGHATPYDAAYRFDLARVAGAIGASGAGIGVIYRQIAQQAQLLSYLDSFRWMAMVCVACCPLALAFRLGRKPGAGEHHMME